MANVFQPWLLSSSWLNYMWRALPPGLWVLLLPPNPIPLLLCSHALTLFTWPLPRGHMLKEEGELPKMWGLKRALIITWCHPYMFRWGNWGPEERWLVKVQSIGAWTRSVLVPLPLGQWPAPSQVGNTAVGFDNEMIQGLTESVLFSSRWIRVSLKARLPLQLFNKTIEY